MINNKIEKILQRITLNDDISKDDLKREFNKIIIMVQNNPDFKIVKQCEITEQKEEVTFEYEGMTLTDFMKKYPDKILNEVFVLEMNQKGYLYLAEGDMLLSEIQISTRLRNALARNGIFLVSQLGDYQRETYLKMRNIGEASYKEVKEICEKYEVKIPTLELLEKDLLPVSFSFCQLLELYEDNIHEARDLEKFSMEELRRVYRYKRKLFKKICKVIEIKKLRVE